MSEDPSWGATRELLAEMGWTSLWRVAVIAGDILGRGIVYILLPDETVASLSSSMGPADLLSRSLRIGTFSTLSRSGTQWFGCGIT